MNNNEEFILTPPSMLANTAGPNSSRFRFKRKEKFSEFKIIQPDRTLHSFRLPAHALGSDCVDQICEVLDIVEKDYFGLYFIDEDSGYKIWINKRLEVKKQIKQKQPYELFFAIKFYTQPNYLLQSQTIEAFFLDLKCQIKRGDIHVPNSKKAALGALIAQAEMGDLNESQGMLYPPYFQSWNSGIAHIIRKEHKNLKGICKRDAHLLLIDTVYDLENYGMHYIRAFVNNENVIVGIGAKLIRIFSVAWKCKTRIPFGSLTQVAFGSRFFSFVYQVRDVERNIVEKKVICYVYNHTLARALFRMVTEDQVFHYQPTVSPVVINHADSRETAWKFFCHKVFKKKYQKRYYYDIEQTKKEAFTKNWQVLNQVTSDTASLLIPEDPPSIHVNLNNQQLHDEDEVKCSPEIMKKKAEIWWGLSDSSTTLAKALLPSDFVTLSPSKDLKYFEQAEFLDISPKDGPVSEEEDEKVLETEKLIATKENRTSSVSSGNNMKLTKEQGRKMYKFLMKIQDEKVCNVCMDELISSVFCPCGHYVACAQCAKKLDKCPVCRELIGYVQFVYTKST